MECAWILQVCASEIVARFRNQKTRFRNQNVRFRNQNLRFRNQNLAVTPSDHYVAAWTWQEIKTPPPPLTTMLHLELHKRSKNPPPPLTTMLHLEFHMRSKPRHPLWPLCCILNLTSDQEPATPSDHYVASWISHEIKTPQPPLTTMLHLELYKRSKPRHPLWPLCCILNFTWDQNPATPSDRLCCILNFTWDQNPATPSDHYVASWTSQAIKTPPPPLTTMLHLEPHKRSKPRHPLWPLCCILNFTSDQNPATPSDHYVASWTSQAIKTLPPRVTTMLHLELHKRSRPATPSDHYVASWTSQEIKTPPPPLTTMLHLELVTRDQNPATPSMTTMLHLEFHMRSNTPQPPLTTMLHLELHKRSKPGHPLWPLCCILNFTWDQNPANPSDHYVASWTSQEIKTPPPLSDHYVASWTSREIKTPPPPSDHYMLHLEFHKRSKTRHPLWPLCCILNFTSDQKPATPSDHCVASWTSQEIKSPPPPLTTMLHLELHKRSKPRHPLWPLCCILNFTWDQNPPPPLTTVLHLECHMRSKPATPSDHYVASWISHEIKTPPPPLTTVLHLELHKRSKPRHPLWPLCCILNFTKDQKPSTPSDHYVAFWTSQAIKTPPPPLTTMLHLELHKRSKPRRPLWPLCCILNFTRDQTPPPPLTIVLHLELHNRSKPRHPVWPLCCILNFTSDQNPATPSDHYVASWTSQAIKTLPPRVTTMLHLELHKRSRPRHPVWPLCCILNFTSDQNPATPLWPLCCILNFTSDQNPATPSDHYVASWISHEIKSPPPPPWPLCCILNCHMRSKPRHPLWPLCCILNFTRDQNPATPSDHYVASWTWQEIKSPPPPLTTMLHLEPHKRSKPRHPLWPLCCILNLTRDQNPATPSDHHVASWTWQEIKTPPPPI